ncbi:MAG: hypothetical protein M3430_15390 [Acidobacteriota bacterium]|nr:hypothetical protein [Acidobacteriota bacterium]
MKTKLMCSLLCVGISSAFPYIVESYDKDASREEAFLKSEAKNQFNKPKIEELKLVARLPAGVQQRVSSLAYDGKKIWVIIYHGRGRYATLDPLTLNWEVSEKDEHHKAIKEVAGAFESPGGVCFAEDKLWIAGSYGDSFGYVNTQDWKVTRVFRGKYRDDEASQSYSDIAYDGSHLWIAWHWFKYDLPTSQTQLLLKIDPETGKVVGEYPIPPGTPNDGAHGLTWDGTKLWHMKDSKLSSIDPANGMVTAVYFVDQIKRPSGLTWDGEALWIAEFNGKIWRLPF